MKVLLAILILSTLALVGVAAAIFWRYRRHIRASDEALRGALEQIETERKIGQR